MKGGRKKNGAQLLFLEGFWQIKECHQPHKSPNKAPVLWQECGQKSATTHHRSGKQGPCWAVSMALVLKVCGGKAVVQKFSVFGEDFLNLMSWIPLGGKEKKSVAKIEASAQGDNSPKRIARTSLAVQ